MQFCMGLKVVVFGTPAPTKIAREMDVGLDTVASCCKRRQSDILNPAV